MAIRWRREAKDTGLMRVTQGLRKMYLHDSTNDLTYMYVQWMIETPTKPAGYGFTIINPSIIKNQISTGRWPDEASALSEAKEWWRRNCVKFLKQYED